MGGESGLQYIHTHLLGALHLCTHCQQVCRPPAAAAAAAALNMVSSGETHIQTHIVPCWSPAARRWNSTHRRRRWSLRERQVGVDWQGEEEGERQGSWPEISSDRGVCLAEEPCEGGRRRGRTTSQTHPTDTCTCTCQRATALLQPRFASSVCLLSSHLSL